MMGKGTKGTALAFNAGLKDFCQAGDCSTWDTKGKYYTRTGPTGQNVVIMKIDVIAAQDLTGTYNEAVFDVATTKDGNGNSTTEQLKCIFEKYAKLGKCESRLFNKSLVTMHQEEKETSVASRKTGTWQNVNSKVSKSGNRLKIRAKRDYMPKKGAVYRPGDELPFYVDLKHEENKVAGKTPLVNMYLFEKDEAPVTVRMLRSKSTYV